MDPFAAYAALYDLDYGDSTDDLLMIQQFAARCGSPLLEIGCGTGRLLVPLAQEGYAITGVDNSPSMLERAREKVRAAALEDRATLVQQDVLDLDLGRRFTLAFLAINTFMHLLTTDEQLAALGRIREHLLPGGLLLLDLFNPDLPTLLDCDGRLTLVKELLDEATGERLLKFYSRTVDLERQLLHMTFIVDAVDQQGILRRQVFPFSIRFLFRYELELLLLHAGFQVEAIYGSYDLDEYASDSGKLIAVARALP